MRFHFPSFALGYGAGVATALVGKQLRPALLEIATAAYTLVDAVAARVAMAQEDVEDVLAEAKARARKPRAKPGPRTRARARA